MQNIKDIVIKIAHIKINNFEIEFNDDVKINPNAPLGDFSFLNIFFELFEAKNEFFKCFQKAYKNPYDVETLEFCLFTYKRFVTEKNPFGHFSNLDLSIYDSNKYSKNLLEKLEKKSLIRNLNNTRHRKKGSKTNGYEFTEKGLWYSNSIVFALSLFVKAISKTFVENLNYYTDETLIETSDLRTILLKLLTILIYSVRQTTEKIDYNEYLENTIFLQAIPLELCQYIVQNKSIETDELFDVLLSIYGKNDYYKNLFKEFYAKYFKEQEAKINIDERIEILRGRIPPYVEHIIRKYVNNTKNPTLEGLAIRIRRASKNYIYAVERTRIQDFEIYIRETRNKFAEEMYKKYKSLPELEETRKLDSILSNDDIEYFNLLCLKKKMNIRQAKLDTKSKRMELRKEGFTDEEITERFKKERKEKKEREKLNSNRKFPTPTVPIEVLNAAKRKKREQKLKEIEQNKIDSSNKELENEEIE